MKDINGFQSASDNSFVLYNTTTLCRCCNVTILNNLYVWQTMMAEAWITAMVCRIAIVAVLIWGSLAATGEIGEISIHTGVVSFNVEVIRSYLLAVNSKAKFRLSVYRETLHNPSHLLCIHMYPVLWQRQSLGIITKNGKNQV